PEAQASLRRLVQDQVTSQIADAAGRRAGTARATAWTVSVGATLLFALVLSLAVIVSRSIANPLQRLTRAATNVSDLANAELVRVADVEQVEEQPPRLAATDASSGHEAGELAGALARTRENVLVLAASRDTARVSAPAPLTDVLRSALAEIEDYQRVTFGAVHDVSVVAPLVPDLVLVFAELLENATSFSPPQSTV